MEIKAGARLRSQVDTTEVIVVRPLPGDVDLTCGGHPMIGAKDAPAAGLTATDSSSDGTKVGKRYTLEGSDLEVLVTKPGSSLIAVAGQALSLKEAKPLPSSD